jgi:septal ring factor EnvC (AmiA/AmiB activator)
VAALSRGLLGTALAAAVAAGVAAWSAEGEVRGPSPEVAAIRAEVTRLEDQLRGLRVREDDLGARLSRLGVEISLQQARVDEATAARAEADRGVTSAAAAAGQLEERLATQRAGLERSVSTLYRMGRGLPIRAFLSLRADGDLPAAVRALRFLAQRDFRAVASYRENRGRLERERELLAARREEATSWLGRERERQIGLVTARNRQQELLEANLGEARRLEGLASDLSEREGRLSTLVSLVAQGSPELAGRSVRDFRGALEWPVEGRVTAEFGPRLDPRYKTRVPHRGVDVTTAPGTEVRAVYGGRVLYAGAFEDLGNLVVLRHPGGVTTLTSGLQALRVAKDDVLTFGAVVGRSSEVVYFEVRVEQRPEDPRQWLRPLLRPISPSEPPAASTPADAGTSAGTSG